MMLYLLQIIRENIQLVIILLPILVAIVGLYLLFLSSFKLESLESIELDLPFIKLKLKNMPLSGKPNLKPLGKKLLFAGILSIGLIVGMIIYTTPVIKITNPKEGSIFPLSNETTISGTISHKPDNQHLWIVAFKSNKYYPFPPPEINGNSWKTISYGAGENTDEYNFSIVAYLSDREANDKFEKYIKETSTKGYNGLDFLPEGAKEYIRIQVIGKR